MYNGNYTEAKKGSVFLRILICDDDQNIIEQLKKYITEFFHHGKNRTWELQSYSSAEELLSDAGAKDIVFLDVEMPGLDGIYAGQELKKKNPNTIIFIVTSYVEYLDEAMRFHVFRYLSKPLDKQRLFRNMKDAIQLYNSTSLKIPIETKEGIFTVNAADIIFIESQDRRIIVYTLSKKFISVSGMNHWIKALNSPCFFQTHRSFIVNMKYVSHFDHFLVYLCGDQYKAYLTKRKYSQFKESYLLFLESTR